MAVCPFRRGEDDDRALHRTEARRGGADRALERERQGVPPGRREGEQRHRAGERASHEEPAMVLGGNTSEFMRAAIGRTPWTAVWLRAKALHERCQFLQPLQHRQVSRQVRFRESEIGRRKSCLSGLAMVSTVGTAPAKNPAPAAGTPRGRFPSPGAPGASCPRDLGSRSNTPPGARRSGAPPGRVARS